MPLESNYVQAWIVIAIIGTILIRCVAIAMKDTPRAYALIWGISFAIFCAVAVIVLLTVASVPLVSESQPSPGRDNFLTPGVFLAGLAYIAVFNFGVNVSFPVVLALGLSPPYYHRSRWYWLLGVITVVVASGLAYSLFALNERYLDDARRTRAQRTAAQATLSAWQNPAPPNRNIGPTRFGEWSYLGAIPHYAGGPESDLVRLEFVVEDRLVRPDTFRWLRKEKALESLRFSYPITDEDLGELKPLTSLKQLQLIDSPMTDRGVAELVALGSLEELELTGAPITAQSLRSLGQMQSLKSVNLSGTRISPDELHQFCKENPTWKPSKRFFGLERHE